MSIIRVSHPTRIINGVISLDGSKSISNRALIIRALSDSRFKIDGLSKSDDSRILENLLDSPVDRYDVGHAGTTFRFLTAYLALQDGQQLLTGSSRMLERPIGPLVDALRSLNCNIKYAGKEGYPPLLIGPRGDLSAVTEVTISAGISSQYITALILIAPTLPNGLTIHLTGNMVSESYLMMTIATVKAFGIQVSYDGSRITIPHQSYTTKAYKVEADWSAASYHYAIAAIANSATIQLHGLFSRSSQGDAAIVEICNALGIATTWDKEVALISKTQHAKQLKYDFINQPDIAQTLAVICAAKGIEADFTGLQTLRIKETDRIDALDKELEKVGSGFKRFHIDENGKEHYKVLPVNHISNTIPRFSTYKDHRMAMAFAPLALLFPIEIEHPEVVSKSYPDFWKDLETLGFDIQTLE